MLQNLSKILIVDNEIGEIDKISNSFHELDIPIYSICYSQANPPVRPPYDGIRLAFFDINLNNGKASDKQMITSFIEALRSCISINNGIFILVFWSSFTELIEEIKKHIDQRRIAEIPSPIIVDKIDKVFISDPAKLHGEILRIISKPEVKILFDYENKVAQAANRTLKTLFDLISQNSDTWGNSINFEKNLDHVLSNIAYSVAGYELAKELPLNSIKQGLNPILINELQNIKFSDDWLSKLTGITNSSKADFNKLNSDFSIKLNTIYHYEMNTETINTQSRGSVIELNLTDDTSKTYFDTPIKDLLSSFLPFDCTKTEKDFRDNIRRNVKFVLIEISASCDYAQNNKRLHNYVLGVLVKMFNPGFLLKQKDCILALPQCEYRNCEYSFFINVRYIYSTNNADFQLFNSVIMQIKDELMNKVSTFISNYRSRIGIIEF